MRGPNRRATKTSRRLRVDQTDAERKLWFRLRNRQIANCKFVRQEPVIGYICDFVCREARLIIEVDGGQHSGSEADIVRDQNLGKAGYRVLRFWNNDVLLNLDGVLTSIESELR